MSEDFSAASFEALSELENITPSLAEARMECRPARLKQLTNLIRHSSQSDSAAVGLPVH
jgi:hypothetical protein